MQLLTNEYVADLKPGNERYNKTDTACQGLRIEVMPSGAKYWRLRLLFGKKYGGGQTLTTLGEFIPEPPNETPREHDERVAPGAGPLTVEEARNVAESVRGRIRRGQPSESYERGYAEGAAGHAAVVRAAQAKTETFGAVAKAFRVEHEKVWSKSRADLVYSFLKTWALPVFGDTLIRDMDGVQIRDMLLKVQAAAPALANEGRSIMSLVCSHAVFNMKGADGKPLLAANIAAGIKLPKVHVSRPHDPLPLELFPEFWAALDKGRYRPETRLALRLLALTGLRGNELRQVEWRWISGSNGNATLTIPADVMKMKNRQPHSVPLSRQAMTCFTALRKLTGKSKWAFPHYTQPEEPMSEQHLGAMVRQVMNGLANKMPFVGGNGEAPMVWGDEAEAPATGQDERERQVFRAHGFRASLKTHSRTLRLGDDDVVELVLGHARKGMDRHYQHADLETEKRALLQKWADVILPEGGTPA